MYENQWYEINATKDNIEIEKIAEGQNIIIIIGENLNKDILDKYWNHSKV